MAMKLTVHHDDATTLTVPVGPAVQVAFEREFNIGMGRAFGEGGEARVEHLYWMAWKAEHAAGHVVKTFNEWLQGVTDVESDVTETAPFDGAPSDVS